MILKRRHWWQETRSSFWLVPAAIVLGAVGLATGLIALETVIDMHLDKKWPLLSGYVSAENLRRLGGTASVAVYRRGRGRAIVMADNPNFCGFWHGTNRLFLNALLFGPITRVP